MNMSQLEFKSTSQNGTSLQKPHAQQLYDPFYGEIYRVDRVKSPLIIHIMPFATLFFTA